jgi:hypothetical protein
MFRALVLLLAGWPLLMPPGMCVCQFARAGYVAPRCSDCGCADKQEDDSCTDRCCECDPANSDPLGDQDVPNDDEQYPPGCPANKKADHSKLLEQHRPLLAVTELPPTPLPLYLDLASCQRFDAPSFAPQPPGQPIYLTLCSLLI